MNKLAFKISVGLVVLFSIGVSSGIVVARQTNMTGRRAGRYKNFEERWIAARIEEYTTQLQLNPEQVATMRPHFNKLASDIRELRADLRVKMGAAVKEMNASIASELPPEQRDALWKLLREKAEKSKMLNSGQPVTK
jgi:hypothetical protein